MTQNPATLDPANSSELSPFAFLRPELDRVESRIREQATQAARRTTDIIAATWEQDAATQAIARHVENIAQR